MALKYNRPVERFNNEGIPRSSLLVTMKTRWRVQLARRKNTCLLCCRPGVNEAGLCDICYSSLDGEELRVALQLIQGVSP